VKTAKVQQPTDRKCERRQQRDCDHRQRLVHFRGSHHPIRVVRIHQDRDGVADVDVFCSRTNNDDQVSVDHLEVRVVECRHDTDIGALTIAEQPRVDAEEPGHREAQTEQEYEFDAPELLVEEPSRSFLRRRGAVHRGDGVARHRPVPVSGSNAGRGRFAHHSSS
jgi:hypothetical protein